MSLRLLTFKNTFMRLTQYLRTKGEHQKGVAKKVKFKKSAKRVERKALSKKTCAECRTVYKKKLFHIQTTKKKKKNATLRDGKPYGEATSKTTNQVIYFTGM